MRTVAQGRVKGVLTDVMRATVAQGRGGGGWGGRQMKSIGCESGYNLTLRKSDRRAEKVFSV